MTSKFKLFPRRSSTTNRSMTFNVGCNELATLSAYGLPDNVSVCINQIHGDPCNCDYFEKEYCQLGRQAGVNDCECESIIAMPGKYVGVLCYTGCEEEADFGDEWAVYVNVCEAHTNFQTLLMAAAVEAKS